jgi:DNA-binding CsgD family transcriptional regulator/tetratricopeptide (TPR) repeat protein
VALRRQLGDPEQEGASLRAFSQMLSFVGRPAEGRQAALEAIALLEQLEPGPELARAYATLAQRCVNWEDVGGAIEWGNRGLELAEQLDDPEIVVHVLTTLGVAEFRMGEPTGRQKLERALEIARAQGLEDGIGRAYLNLSMQCLRRRLYREAASWQDKGLEYCVERGLDYWAVCLLAGRGWVHLAEGRWTEAAEAAQAVLRQPVEARVAQSMALMVTGVVRARRGDPDAWAALDEGLAVAKPTTELMQIAPVVAGMAEAAWLEGRPERVSAEVEKTLGLAIETGATWETGELACWSRRFGLEAEVELPVGAEPYDLTLADDHETAAQRWSELGCEYEAALARTDSDDEDTLRKALDGFQQLGARPAAAIVTRKLRERGARDLPQGPRKATRENTANLTPRELEVLELLTEGLRNQDIAERLFVAEKTVDHHVSAILRKLDAKTRAEASVKAVRLGLTNEDR